MAHHDLLSDLNPDEIGVVHWMWPPVIVLILYLLALPYIARHGASTKRRRAFNFTIFPATLYAWNWGATVLGGPAADDGKPAYYPQPPPLLWISTAAVMTYMACRNTPLHRRYLRRLLLQDDGNIRQVEMAELFRFASWGVWLHTFVWLVGYSITFPLFMGQPMPWVVWPAAWIQVMAKTRKVIRKGELPSGKYPLGTMPSWQSVLAWKHLKKPYDFSRPPTADEKTAHPEPSPRERAPRPARRHRYLYTGPGLPCLGIL